MSLFRQEALDNRGEKLYGKVVIPTYTRGALLSSIFLSLLILIIGVGLLGTYTETQKVEGYLVPTTGIIKIKPKSRGLLSDLHVKPDATVHKNALLATVDTASYSKTATSLEEKKLNIIDQQIFLLESQTTLATQIFETELLEHQDTIASLEKKILTIQEQSDLQDQIAASAQTTYENSSRLRADGHISQIELEARKQAFLEAQQRYRSYELELNASLASLQSHGNIHARKAIDFKYEEQRRQEKLLDLQSNKAVIQGEESYSLYSPVNGKIEAINVTVGKAIDPSDTLFVIIPESGELVAELFVPSRSIGQIRVGQKVRLAIDAFPYQRYGTFPSKIMSISRGILLPDEINGTYPILEPSYKVVAQIQQGKMKIDGEPIPLTTGLKLKATISIRSYSLFRWLLGNNFK